MNHADESCQADPNIYALSIHFDGGARPNTGTGGCGGVVRRRIVGTTKIQDGSCPTGRLPTKTFNDSCSWSDDDEVERFEYNMTLGDSDCTNNEAEYMSLIIAMYFTLERFEQRCLQCHCYPLHYASIDIYGDSNLVIQQMAGHWQVRGDNLQTLHRSAVGLLQELTGSWTDCEECTGTVRFHHVPRDSNVEADKLASQAISRPSGLFGSDFPILPWNELLYHFHRESCTTCIKRAHSVAEAASAPTPVSKNRQNRRNRGQ